MHQKLPPTFIEGTFKDWALEILTAKEVAHCGGSVGLDWIGLDRIGLGWVGLDWIGLDWIGLDWIGLDWIRFINWTRRVGHPSFFSPAQGKV